MPTTSPTRWRSGFWSLIVTQFQGAFSDNALKNLVILLILGSGITQAEKDKLVPYVLLLFSAPFILFSMAGGFLADRFSKRRVAIGTKALEIFVMLVAVAGLALQNLPLEFAAIFLVSSQAAIFGPAKYGILPEMLPLRELSWGNGVLELGTFLAILTGTVAAGYLSEDFRGHQLYSGLILLGLALFGTIVSLGITKVPAADPHRKFQPNFVKDLWSEIRVARRDNILWLAMLANMYFWFLGGLLQPIILLYGKEVLHLGDKQNTYLQAALAVGIGVGSLAAGYLSRGKIEYGLIPAGSLGLAVFSAALSAPFLSFEWVAILLAALGVFAGFFAVPVLAIIQHRPSPERKGNMQAAANLLSFFAIFLAGGAYYVLISLFKLTPGEVFLLGFFLTLAVTLFTLGALPESMQRWKSWLGLAPKP
jgi:acyl-[acyl-carrier-protein]-phospholipid O-acyltransferase/long-chain-fatty-acid--[acyl-carrier-protein] ligase